MQQMPTPHDLATLAHIMLLAKGDLFSARGLVDTMPLSKRCVTILKDVIAAGDLSNPTWAGNLANYSPIPRAFIESLVSQSVFAFALKNGGREIPVGERVVCTTTTATAAIVSGAAPAPVTRLSLSGPSLKPQLASGILVFSNEVIQSRSEAARRFVEKELQKAVSKAIDAAFLDGIVTSYTASYAASGLTTSDIRLNFEKLFNTVNTAGAGQLLFILAPDAANFLICNATGDGSLFNTLGPRGGEIASTPAIVSDQLPSGSVMLLDLAAIALGFSTIALQASAATGLQMSDNPVVGSASLVSMFQANSVALRATAAFGFELVRESGVAVLSGLMR